MTSVVKALVSGGKATPGPPLGPSLGPLGVNIKNVIDKINNQTKDYEGMQVPVSIIVNDDKTFTIEVGIPPTSSLLMKELGIQKGSGKPNTEKVGDINIQKIINIAKMKKDTLLSYDLKNAIKEIAGTAVSIGITIENLNPKDFQKNVESGVYDNIIYNN